MAAYTTTLLTFASDADGGDVFVVTWYDQSTNGNYATQGAGANQPKIVSSGAVITEGTSAKPAIEFDGSNDRLEVGSVLANQIDITASYTITGVASPEGTGFRTIVGSAVDTNNRTAIGLNTSNDFCFEQFDGSANRVSKSSVTLNVQYLFFATNTNKSQGLWLNSVAATDADVFSQNPTNDFVIGARQGGGNPFDGPIQELVVWTSNQNAARVGIETNINDYWL